MWFVNVGADHNKGPHVQQLRSTTRQHGQYSFQDWPVRQGSQVLQDGLRSSSKHA